MLVTVATPTMPPIPAVELAMRFACILLLHTFHVSIWKESPPLKICQAGVKLT